MADIGDKLRSAREAKGLSIEDIEKATKIQSRYLTAIEQNDFDKLPGDFYVRAFIRQYAQIVGLDGKELLSEYHQDIPESKPDEYVENSIDNKSEEVRETTDSKKNLWKNYLPRIAVGLGVIVVILIIYFLYARLSSSGQNNNNAEDNVTVSSQTSSKKKKPVVKKAKSTVKIVKLSDNQYRVTGLKKNRKLVVKAGDQTINASVSINGTIQWQQSLTSGQKHTLTLPSDARNVVITLGNDAGTSVKIGGKKVPYTANGNYLSLSLLVGKQRKQNTNSTSTQNSNTTNNGYSSNTQQNTQTSQNTQSHAQSSRAQSHAQNHQTQQSQSTTSNTAQSSTQAQNNNNNDNH